MGQNTALDRQKKGKAVIDADAVIWLRNRCYPVLMLLTKTKVKFRIETENGYNPLPGKPIIFAVNHSAFSDMPVVLNAIKRHAYIYAGKQRLPFADYLFFVLNGTVWVDRKDREDRAFSKKALLSYLAKGQPVLWFPEGTWNLTPDLPVMPLKWGIIEVARRAGAQIIPVALDYDRKEMTCSVRFGEPMAGEDFADLAEGIRKLRDTMATLRWEQMSRYPVLRRRDVSVEALRAEVYRAVEEYPAIDWEYEQGCIYRPVQKGE